MNVNYYGRSYCLTKESYPDEIVASTTIWLLTFSFSTNAYDWATWRQHDAESGGYPAA